MLSDEFDASLEKFGATENAPTKQFSPFLTYVLNGRDAVACNLLADIYERFEEDCEGRTDEQLERDRFWCYAGLVDAGRLDLAEQLIRKFLPSDQRLLLALHMGCFTVENLKYSEPDAKKIASRIAKRIGPRIAHLMAAMVEEWKTQLLEMRRGEIAAIEADSDRVEATKASGTEG